MLLCACRKGSLRFIAELLQASNHRHDSIHFYYFPEEIRVFSESHSSCSSGTKISLYFSIKRSEIITFGPPRTKSRHKDTHRQHQDWRPNVKNGWRGHRSIITVRERIIIQGYGERLNSTKEILLPNGKGFRKVSLPHEEKSQKIQNFLYLLYASQTVRSI